MTAKFQRKGAHTVSKPEGKFLLKEYRVKVYAPTEWSDRESEYAIECLEKSEFSRMIRSLPGQVIYFNELERLTAEVEE